MNLKLFNPDYLKSLCQKYGLAPSRRYGQNFLINPEPIEKMIEAAEITKGDTVIEVGPGFGVLTFALAAKAGRVAAFEIEKKLKPYWDEILQCHFERSGAERKIPRDYDNVEIVWGNVLMSLRAKPRLSRDKLREESHERKGMFRGVYPDLVGAQHDNNSVGIASPLSRGFASLPRNDKYKVVANLPYQITSNVIRRFLEADNPPSLMVLMIQKEVAERVCAKPGKMSLLSVAVQYYADTKIIALVPHSCFWPEPRVDSAVVSLRARVCAGSNGIASPSLGARNDNSRADDFFRVVKAGFAQRRKLLLKNLPPFGRSSEGREPLAGKNKTALKEAFRKIGLSEKARAQELSVEQWRELAEEIKIK